MVRSKPFTKFDIDRKLESLNWKGKFFSYSNIVTYLSEENETLAVVTYTDNSKKKISTVKFEKEKII